MRVIDKIKEKGLAGCIKSARCRVIKYYNNMLFERYKKLPIDDHSIVFESEGDCCDNAYALFDYMKHSGDIGKYKITWLVDYPENFHDEENVKYVKKNIYENFSACTIKALRTCNWYIYDHSNLMADYEKRDGQTLIYLSHGWGYKASKGMDLSGCKSKYDFMISTGPLAAVGLSEYWGTPLNQTIVTGYPRLDYLFKKDIKIDKLVENKWHFNKYEKVILWMPTFRQSIRKNLSETYFQNETGLPLFDTVESLRTFDDFLSDINILMLFKLHHLQAELSVFSLKFKNIIIVRDEDIRDMGIQLYQLIKFADVLISDYSSISIDYMVMNRPIIYTLDDYEEYDKSRGLFPKNAIDYMPGYHVYKIQELEDSIKEIVQGIDNYSENRKDILDNYHTYKDGNSSKRVLNLFGIVN